MTRPNLSGRGTTLDPENRYERIHLEQTNPGDSATPTIAYRDSSKSILAQNDSPDLRFRFSLNPYRGCEHGCVYCYARPSHEFLSFSAGLDFERRILVKRDAPDLLRKALRSPRWQPQVVALSGNTDCYQPIERQLGITRRCLEVFAQFRNPVGIITKSALVTRDLDLLRELARFDAIHAFVSVTTLDGDLARRMEPRASTPERRLRAIEELSRAGIPVGVMTAPIVPGLNDHEIPSILERAAAAGAVTAGWTMLRLSPPVDQLFDHWLAESYPERRNRVLHRIRECRSGSLSDPRFGTRMSGEGVYAKQIAELFWTATRRHGLDGDIPPLSVGSFRVPPQSGDQLQLC